MTDHPFAAEAETVKRATGLPAAIAADLTVFGGILRCGECGGERPLDDVAGYLGHGWPKHCGKTMTWVTLKLLAAEGRDVPGDCELVAESARDWRLRPGKRCRDGAAPGRHACGRPSVAELKRGSKQYPSWWTYCLEHLRGRGVWIEDGKVMHWILREKNVND